MPDPQWQRLANELRIMIESGELAPGTKLPSFAHLQQEYGVASSVVRQAVLALEAQGYVEGVRGSGVFVAER
ncbi:winged helix-turn-helix domain-containing protein [Micromonospora zhanjiangensis]|uniref:Winged helix-turn-helix domain-containing protein n=1 Tax=Micromonospora zhanjiangensis TaxID=1522057 RepID=A0ABV8KJ01_9ACTN